MKNLLLGILVLGSTSSFASDLECREAIEQVSITSTLLREYETKISISPEMEANRIRIVNILKNRLPAEIEAAESICSQK